MVCFQAFWIQQVVLIFLSAAFYQYYQNQPNESAIMTLLSEKLVELPLVFLIRESLSDSHLAGFLLFFNSFDTFRVVNDPGGYFPCLSYRSSCSLTPAISQVLIRQHLIFCSPTWPTCCNSPRKCMPVK